MKMRLFLYAVLLFAFLQYSPNVFAANITTITSQPTSAPRYGKFEVSFQIDRQYPSGSFLPYYFYDANDTPTAYPNRNSPYGVDGISIDAHFTAPSGKTLVAPAFYYQDYIRSNETMTPTTNFSWKIRFAPQEIGSYSYYFTVTDKNGTTKYPQSGKLQMNATASQSKGFVRVSPRDSRFLEFDSGDSFIPNSSGRQFWREGKRSSYYEQSFAEFKQYGINFTRIWDQNDGYGLTVEGHFDAYKWPDDYKPDTDAIAAALPKGTQMNQRGNYDEDRILDSAIENGVYIELSSKGDPYWIWDASVYDEGWNPSPAQFDSVLHLNYWKRNYRYRIARWGYATSIATWEVWNEHGHIGQGSPTWNFYQQLTAFIKATDPYDHLVTTSQGSQAWSPAFWATSGMDVGNYHDYMMSSRYSADLTYDAANFVYRFAQCLRGTSGATCNGLSLGDGSTYTGNQKPYIWGELDTSGPAWNEPNPQPKATHAMRWAGLFSPIGTTGIDWFWDLQTPAFIATKHAEAKIASQFFADIDYAGKNFKYFSTSDVHSTSVLITPSNSKLRVLAMIAGNNQEAYAWVQNKDDQMWNTAVNTAQASGTFPIPLLNGTYTVETWNTFTGQKTTTTTSASNGVLSVSVSGLARDVAIKIRSTSLPAPTPTATPQLSACQIADINQSNFVDLSDYTILVTSFFKTPPTNARADINGDGAVDLSDYTLLIRSFFLSCV